MKRRYNYTKIKNTAQMLGERSYNDIELILKNRLQTAPQFIERLGLESVLKGHSGCVNSLQFSDNGKLLASASDDYHVILWNPLTHQKVHEIVTPHRGNIFSVKFLPKSNDANIVTGAGDNMIYVYDINYTQNGPIWKCSCHSMRVKRLAVAPEVPYMFWSSAEDGNILQFDIREPHECKGKDKISLISLTSQYGLCAEAKCIAINPRRTEMLAVGTNDCYTRCYDRRMLELQSLGSQRPNAMKEHPHNKLPTDCVTYYSPGHLKKNKDMSPAQKAATYVTFSPNGRELLVNMGAEQIYLYDIDNVQEPVYLDLPQCDSDNLTTLDSPRRKIPKEVEHLKQLGNECLAKEKYLQAINQYTMAIQCAPNCATLYLNRATALMKRQWFGDVYAALRDCHEALRLDPTYIKAHFRLARALLDLGFIDDANECLTELKHRFPNYATNHGVLMLMQDIKSAIDQQNSHPTAEETLDVTENELYWRSRAKDYTDRYVGHCNTKTDIKEANFFGNDANYIVAGSDDGNFFIWDRKTKLVTNIYHADETIVNCVQSHPDICMLATSGIDHEVRLWSPQLDQDTEEDLPKSDLEAVITENQNRMITDPFIDITGPGAVCRTS